jgi:hypothetical protein
VHSRFFSLALIAAAMLPLASANVLYNVSIDTAPLISNAAGPFSLDFQFNDGSGSDDGNNTVTLSNFSFGSGAPTGSPSISGTVVGDLMSSLSLTDGTFFNDFTQSFLPGSTLDFNVDMTTNVDLGGVPDLFTLAILDNMGVPIPTLGPFDTVLYAEISSSTPSLLGFASDTSRNAFASGMPIALDAPVITPEPSHGWLLAGGFLAVALWFRSRRSASIRA